MKWEIDKSFDFCYGHRVHNQTLNTEFTENNDGCLACRHLHGHQGKIKVFLESDELNDGMVTDFKHLGWFKNFLDDNLDHKFIMDINDPLITHEAPEFCHEGKLVLDMCEQHPNGFYTLRLNLINVDPAEVNSQALIEKYEGMVFVDFVPTSENLCAWFLEIAKHKMRMLNVTVSAVEYWETPRSHCRVTNE